MAIWSRVHFWKAQGRQFSIFAVCGSFLFVERLEVCRETGSLCFSDYMYEYMHE